MDKLIRDINNKLDKWNERSSFTIKGVKNLSRSDMDVLIMYAETLGRGLTPPTGAIMEVLIIYGWDR